VGRAGRCFVITGFYQTVRFAERMRNACGKTCGMPQVLNFQEFYAFYSAYSAYAEMYRKNGRSCLQKSCQGVGWAGRGRFFCICGISGKKFLKCLIFKDLLYSAIFPHPFRILSAGFPQCVKPLIFNALLDVSKCLFISGFTQRAMLGGWVKGRVLNKQARVWLSVRC